MPSKKKVDTTTPIETHSKILTRSRQIKLALGLLVLVIGLFVCLSILSYVFTWQADQDALLTSRGILYYLQQSQEPVSNWGGKIGAAIAHLLVYQGFGIASFAIGAWFIAIGLNVLYGHKRMGIVRYLRWLSILLLILAPALSFLFPKHHFPYGGVVGSAGVQYLNTMIGRLGTGMLLLAAAAFFFFIILALDIRPMIRRAKRAAQSVSSAVGNGINSLNQSLDKENESQEPIIEPQTKASIKKATANIEPITDLKPNNDDAPTPYNITAFEKETAATENINSDDNEEPKAELEDEYHTWLQKKLGEQNQPQNEEVAPTQEVPSTPLTPNDIALEVKAIKEEEADKVILHGTHISIQENEPYDPEDDLPDFRFPTLDLLEERGQDTVALDKEELEKNKNQIISTLKSFGIEISKISAIIGPTVTLYEIIPAEGVRISKIRNLEDDIALNLAALGIRIIAPIPGRGTIGIEVPNAHKQIVSMKTLLASEKFVHSKMSLPIALGKKIDNENYIVDLATMPHLLVAGATGQGKSVGINAILISLLYKKHPSQLKFVMVDPKIVELSIYRKIEKHYLAKLPNEEEAIITDTKKVINTLNSLCIEMDNRYELLKEANTRNIKEYNEKFVKRKLNPNNGHKYLPFIVLVIDEFADLIMTAGKEIEMPIARLAQKARAVGMHIIVATQRPSVNVITGVIKANFPARIAFKVSSKIDSRTILDTGGAEQLIGRGDMLISHGSELLRLQCAFVDTPEVEYVVNHIGEQRGYLSAFELPEFDTDEESEKIVDLTNRDKMFEECARLVVQTGNGSTSNLQRRLNLGYNRAGRIMDQLEAAGIVGAASGSKPREVLIKTEHELEQFLDSLS